jgi:hypothetical protein
MNADNSHSAKLLTCKKCGRKYQSISGQVKRCVCGGTLQPEPRGG